VELGWARPKRRRREGDWAREEGRWAARGERGPRERGGFFFCFLFTNCLKIGFNSVLNLNQERE
jgi:hypothetical protein